MNSSEIPAGAETVSSERPSFLLYGDDLAANAAAAFNFAPGTDVDSEDPTAPAGESNNQTSEASAAPTPAEFNLLKELQAATSASDGLEPVSKGELALVLKGLARVLHGDSGSHELALAEKTAENTELKELLMEAQETIIGLLNDRVFDRAKIARLEAETKLIPDLQSQANRAMGLAIRSEDVQKELTYVRTEVDRLRTSYLKSEEPGFFGRLFKR